LGIEDFDRFNKRFLPTSTPVFEERNNLCGLNSVSDPRKSKMLACRLYFIENYNRDFAKHKF